MTETCTHPTTELRFRIIANGSRVIQYQCLTYGTATSNALKQSNYTVEQLANLPAWDAKLADTYWEQQKTQAVQQRECVRIEKQEKYQEYLKTPAWLYKRELVFDRDKHWCQGCLKAPATEVHHLTYANIYDEFMFELVSVCKPCHRRLHDQ